MSLLPALAVAGGATSPGAIPFWDSVASPTPAGAIPGFTGTGTVLSGTTIGTDVNGRAVTISPEGALYAPNIWDQVWLAGHKLPGVCSAKGLPTLKIDAKKAGGVDGATITVQGYLPGPIEIESLIWTPDQWSLWQQIIGDIWRIPGKHSKTSDLAVPISSPGLDWLKINLAVVLGITPPEPGPLRGTRVIKVKSIEFVNLTKYIKTARPAAPIVPLAQPLRSRSNPADPASVDGAPTGPAPQRLAGAA